jgi:hypothetical protein
MLTGVGAGLFILGLTRNAPTACVLGTLGAALTAEGIANADLCQVGQRVTETTQRAAQGVTETTQRAAQGVQAAAGRALSAVGGRGAEESWPERVPSEEL